MDFPTDKEKLAASENYLSENQSKLSVYVEDDIFEAFSAGIQWHIDQMKEGRKEPPGEGVKSG